MDMVTKIESGLMSVKVDSAYLKLFCSLFTLLGFFSREEKNHFILTFT